MQWLSYKQKDFQERLSTLVALQAVDDPVEKSVAAILHEVAAKGDKALITFAQKFDNVSLSPANFAVKKSEFPKNLSKSFQQAVSQTLRNVQDFSRQSIPRDWEKTNQDGGRVGERYFPFERVGVYIPGGTAPLVSTCIMTIAIAKTAGVKEIVVCTPCDQDGKVNPHVLYAAVQSGATEIYRIGGAHAIGAMAYGTDTIKRVDKIVGPGNAYVTAAKRQVYGRVDIDLIAGPSEVLIIADKHSNPSYIAMDMLAQAEHGSGNERAILVTDDEAVGHSTAQHLAQYALDHSRKELTRPVLKKGVYVIHVRNLKQAVDVTNFIAPEHLEIHARSARSIMKDIRNVGAVFLGEFTPASVGDFVAGPSHVLPTGGTARSFSGLSITDFFRRMSVIEYDKLSLRKAVETVEEFATAEGLEAHGLSASIRF